MHISTLASNLELSIEDLRELISKLAKDKASMTALCFRVQKEISGGRPLNDEGTDLVSPEDLKVRIKKNFGSYKANQEVTVPYAEGLSLLEERLASVVSD